MTLPTFTQVSEALLAAGGREYPHPIDGDMVRVFSFPVEEGPECELNDKPPAIHVTSWRDFNGHPGRVTFEVCGQFGGEWLKADIYSVSREDAIAFLPKAKKTLIAIWATYCHSIVSA